MAFATTNRKWQWNLAPFGKCPLPGKFCYLMSQVLSALNFCFTYLDDVLIYSTPCEEHIQHLQNDFSCLKLAKLKIRISKCQLFKKTFTLPRHLICEQSIQPLPEKLIAIMNLKEPNNVDELCHFFVSLATTGGVYPYLLT